MEICFHKVRQLKNIRRHLMKLRLQPIRVFCLHHVSPAFDADSMYKNDWMALDKFQEKVLQMQSKGVEFVSISDAYRHVCKDLVRWRKYAVLTFDDGYASLKDVLPWLMERSIPVTLFINGKYLDGVSYREKMGERYLTKQELFALDSPNVEIGSHGWEHIDATKQALEEFAESLSQNIEQLSVHPRYVPFHAYTWGKHNLATDAMLQKHGIVPVLSDGVKNFNDKFYIHRELL